MTGDLDSVRKVLYALESQTPLLFVNNLQVAARENRPRLPDGRMADYIRVQLNTLFEVSGYLRKAGGFLLVFAIAMPLAAAGLGLLTAHLIDLSVGGAVLLATLFASASYIAAPAAMRIAIPEANPALSIGAALGITFPFNLLVGIPLYHSMATRLIGDL